MIDSDPDSEIAPPEDDWERGEASLSPTLERLTDLERRSLLAEQARQQAHRLRSPLSVIDLIAESLQMESQADARGTERLARIKSAAEKLAIELSDTVRSTCFGAGIHRPGNPVALASRVVYAFGGEVVTPAAELPQMTLPVESEILEAALVHALRLVGVGTDCNGVCAQRPSLSIERRDGDLLLIITVQGEEPADTPRERSDLRLMELAAGRAAKEHGGSFVLGPESATFRLPLSNDAHA
jgi:hypothetical protein